MNDTVDILPLLERLHAIARNGLHYSQNVYDQQRYTELLEITNEYAGLALDLPPAEVRAKLAAEPIPLTPKLGADAAIFDAEGRMLLMLRADNRKWCLPCGFVEPGESPEQAAIREAREETGLDVEVLELVGVFTRLPTPEYGTFTLVGVVYLCHVVGGHLRSSHEDLGLRYWHLDDVPVWHAHHEAQARAAYQKWRVRSKP